MAILDQIIETKKAEVRALKKYTNPNKFKNAPHFNRTCNSLKEKLLLAKRPEVIAEFKQKSPSKGIINSEARVEKVTNGYAKAGAAAISVLTDGPYFGGNLSNLIKAREANPETPILRKEFMIDPIQVYEAKASGADLVLLIAACLEKEKLHKLAKLAKELGMEVLTEIHNEKELDKISPYTDLVGVNNRNLKTFEVDIQTSVNLAKHIPESFVKISESGLSEPETLFYLQNHGYSAFLMGETFMRSKNPAKACEEFISKLER